MLHLSRIQTTINIFGRRAENSINYNPELMFKYITFILTFSLLCSIIKAQSSIRATNTTARNTTKYCEKDDDCDMFYTCCEYENECLESTEQCGPDNGWIILPIVIGTCVLFFFIGHAIYARKDIFKNIKKRRERAKAKSRAKKANKAAAKEAQMEVREDYDPVLAKEGVYD